LAGERRARNNKPQLFSTSESAANDNNAAKMENTTTGCRHREPERGEKAKRAFSLASDTKNALDFFWGVDI